MATRIADHTGLAGAVTQWAIDTCFDAKSTQPQARMKIVRFLPFAARSRFNGQGRLVGTTRIFNIARAWDTLVARKKTHPTMTSPSVTARRSGADAGVSSRPNPVTRSAT